MKCQLIACQLKSLSYCLHCYLSNITITIFWDFDNLALLNMQENCPTENDPPSYGICFVDTAIGEFNLVSFVDDIDRTQFETLIMQVKPKEIVYEKVSIRDLN